MFGLGAGEILIILAFALIFIGPKKLPELARNLGKGIREFQKAKDDLMTHVNESSREDEDKELHHKKHDELEEDHHPSLTGVNDPEDPHGSATPSTDADRKIDGEEAKEVEEEVEKMKTALQSNNEEKSS